MSPVNDAVESAAGLGRSWVLKSVESLLKVEERYDLRGAG